MSLLDSRPDLTRTMMLDSDWKFADGSMCVQCGQHALHIVMSFYMSCVIIALPSFGLSRLHLRRHRRKPVRGGPISTSRAARAMTLPGTGGCAVGSQINANSVL